MQGYNDYIYTSEGNPLMTCCCRQLIEGRTGEAEVNPVVAAGKIGDIMEVADIIDYLDLLFCFPCICLRNGKRQ
jgi:hypothetical protein